MEPNSTQQQPTPTRRRPIWLVAGLVGGLAILVGVISLPKLIGTPDRVVGPGELGTPLPTETPTATPTPLPTPTITPTPPGSTPVAVAPAEGWTFEGVRIQPDPGLGDLLVYGEAINSSGAPQRILGLQAALYDSQGQSLDLQVTDDYWPIETVPAEGRMPFELTVIGPSQADRVELQIETEPGQPPRTDFELTEVEGQEREADYCVTGRARNLGQPLDSYLMVVAVLYDDDDRVINWGIGYQPASATPIGDDTVVVSACAERFFHTVARYELRAWGE
jgi:hypothetical protein